MARGRAAARGRGRKAAARDAPPDVFRDMLRELPPDSQTEDARPAKRPRLGVSGAAPKRASANKSSETPVGRADRKKNAEPVRPSTSPASEIQELDFNPLPSSDDTDEFDESDEFEDVEIPGTNQDTNRMGEASESTADAPAFDLVLDLGGDASQTSSARKRRAVTSISDKRLVIQTHKLHLLCLISHVSLRNHWCNDERAQKLLRKIVPRKARREMEYDDAEDQYTRDQKLRNGLRQASKFFKESFTINATGLKRAWWDAPENNNSPPSLEDLDMLTSVDDFRSAASTLAGSRDVGAQLFCAMLRSLGLEVRLVCSLQPLPLSGSVRPQAPSNTTSDPVQVIRYAETRGNMPSASQDSPAPQDSEEAGDSWRTSNIRRRLHGSAARTARSSQAPSPNPGLVGSSSALPRFRESAQPIFWVEVFTPAYQKWICVDSLVTETVSQPSKLEPAQKDIRNSMSYVVGLEEDGSLRDVTRRYTLHFNAKIRKSRLDKLPGSEDSQWWQRVLRIYRRPRKLARDDIEDSEMQRREEREPMPRSMEDFKGHPVYVLERHLHQNEVIHPKREIGVTGAGKSGDEAVFRRQDVHKVKSGDAWYRVGRVVKVGEQPLKRLAPKRKTRAVSQDSGDDEAAETAQGLYAAFQTELYQAPPAQNGRLPRNAFGNLDVYVPSMIPPGAFHFLHPSTKVAAKLLGIDYVDAVTGFEFRGRNGNPIIRGAIIAAEYKDAVLEVLRGMAREKADAEAHNLQVAVLSLWRRFLLGLRINERVAGYAKHDDIDDQSDSQRGSHASADNSPDERAVQDGGSGFFQNGNDVDSHEIVPAEGALAISAIDLEAQDFTIVEGPPLEVKMKGVASRVSHEHLEMSTRRAADTEHRERVPVEDTGGGFLVEQDEEQDDSIENLKGTYNELFDDPTDVTPVLSEQDIVNSSPKKQHQQDNSPAVETTEEFKHPTTSSIADQEAGLDRQHHAPVDEAGAVLETGSPLASEEHDSDKGSLLSEDPEDVDADPEWLG